LPSGTHVEKFYDENAQREWERLDRHRTEFAVTLRALADYLPQPPASILDIGGGPGRYAIALTQQGYQVTLFDLSQGNLALARTKAAEAGVELAGYVHGNATRLSHIADESFDVVLLMGPLYHLVAANDRQQAAREAGRVLKRDGLIFAAFITRYAPLRRMARTDPVYVIEHADELEIILAQGALPHRAGRNFTDAYFAHPAEIEPFMEKIGFEHRLSIACEGVVSEIDAQINELSGAHWQVWVDLNYRLGKDPATHATAEHVLYIGRKQIGTERS
jgi:ubiquinone/menaquinone biosynthesis C-methylase UbiE